MGRTSPRAQRSRYRTCPLAGSTSYSGYLFTSPRQSRGRPLALTPHLLSPQSRRGAEHDVHPRAPERQVLRPPAPSPGRQPAGHLRRLRPGHRRRRRPPRVRQGEFSTLSPRSDVSESDALMAPVDSATTRITSSVSIRRWTPSPTGSGSVRNARTTPGHLCRSTACAGSPRRRRRRRPATSRQSLVRNARLLRSPLVSPCFRLPLRR